MAKVKSKTVSKRSKEKVNVKKTIKKKRIKTRQISSTKFGGLPSELSSEETCTLREIIQYFYHLKNVHSNTKSDFEIYNVIANNVQTVWQKILPSVPLMIIKAISTKIYRVMTKVNLMNSKKKSPVSNNITANIDKLFDISLCKCSLPDKVACGDRYKNKHYASFKYHSKNKIVNKKTQQIDV